MRLSTFLCFGLLAVALGSLAPQRADAWANVCADNILPVDCFGNSTSCHYNVTAAACQNGTATTCEDIYTDTVTCLGTLGASLGCAVNAYNKHCYKTLVACSAIVSDPYACNLRGDCMVNATDPLVGCLSGTNSSKPYGYNTDPKGCAETGYFYDLFAPSAAGAAGKCFYSSATARAVYGLSCDAYSGYPAPYAATACLIHTGCSYDVLTGACTATSTAITVPDVLPTFTNRNLGDTDKSFMQGYLLPVVVIGGIIVLFSFSLCMHSMWSVRKQPVSAGTGAKSGSKKKGTGRKARASERELSGILTDKH